MTNYSKQWSSANPGLLIIMIDQSSSMSEDFSDGESKADFAAKAVNNVIRNIIDRNFAMEQPKNRCRIGLIGYGSEARLIREDSLAGLFNSPAGISPVTKKINAGDGTLVETTVNRPYWIEPECSGMTNMVGAFHIARDLIELHLGARPDAPVPVIVSISDGQPNKGGGYEEVKAVVREITALPSENGSPLVFNAHIEQNSFNCRFPADRSELPPNEHAAFIFDLSSVVPDAYRPAAAMQGITLKENARGCMISTDADGLVKLINFGSSQGFIPIGTGRVPAPEVVEEYFEEM